MMINRENILFLAKDKVNISYKIPIDRKINFAHDFIFRI